MKQIIKRTLLGFGIIVVLVATLATGATLQRDYGVGSPYIDLHVMFADMNNERLAHHERPVTESYFLDSSAAAHCADMVKQNYFAHTNPQGKTPQDWINATNLPWLVSGENITADAHTAAVADQSFWNSPDHRANVLNAKYNFVGFATCSAPSYPNIVVEQFIDFPS